jgi:hypothetical protein
MVEEGTNSTSVLGKVEGILEPILSPRQPLKTVEESIIPLSINDQRFALHWIEVVSVSNI